MPKKPTRAAVSKIQTLTLQTLQDRLQTSVACFTKNPKKAKDLRTLLDRHGQRHTPVASLYVAMQRGATALSKKKPSIEDLRVTLDELGLHRVSLASFFTIISSCLPKK